MGSKKLDNEIAIAVQASRRAQNTPCNIQATEDRNQRVPFQKPYRRERVSTRRTGAQLMAKD